jgi:predicted ATP-grasp superfamily ATP-dependent carboligase
MEKIAELLIKKEYISGEDFSVMVENPDKIEEFKNTDDIVVKAEEKVEEKTEVTDVDDKVKEPKKTIKKANSRKKA